MSMPKLLQRDREPILNSKNLINSGNLYNKFNSFLTEDNQGLKCDNGTTVSFTDIATTSEITQLDNKIIPIHQGGSGTTSIVEGMNVFNGNYLQECWTEATQTTGTITKNVTFTSKGRPIFIHLTINMQGNNTNHWITAYLYKENNLLKSTTIVSPSSSINSNGTISYLDIVGAGTHTYTFKIQVGSGTITFNEANLSATPLSNQPLIIIYEI